MATTMFSIPALPPSPRPLHPINPLTPPATTQSVFKFTATISTRPATPASIHSAPDTPPASPSDDTQSIESTDSSLTVPSETPVAYVLHPPDRFEVIRHRDKATMYSISAAVVAQAYRQTQSQPMPPAAELFPWLHGLNPRNSGQLAFFNAQCSAARLPPINIGYRGLTIVHVPAPFGCYRPGRLVGAVNHPEILGRAQRDGHFLDPDPPKGICLRNFHIQVPKMALLSDIVVYSPRGQTKEVLDVAEKIAQAQRFIRMKFSACAMGPIYNTFVVSDDIDVFERNHPELVAIDSCGRTTDNKLEFLSQEREEMRRLTAATRISQNVYLGNSADALHSVIEFIDDDGKISRRGFDVVIEAKDMAHVASAAALKDAETFLNGGAPGPGLLNGWYGRCLTRPVSLEFPSSSPPTSRHDPEAIIAFCEWIYHIAHTSGPDRTEDFDMINSDMPSPSSRTVLIHCQDGYTESTFLALAYIMFAEGITADEAWLRLHVDLGRSFFAFETDLKVLTYLQPHLLARSPTSSSIVRVSTPLNTPTWFSHAAFDGSFPSRILPHMYLGNLQHANNPEMLRTLGITRVLSIGEQVIWDTEREYAAGMNLLYLDNVQDNGIDPLLEYIDTCLEFLGKSPFLRNPLIWCVDEGYRSGEKTLVHCRVGVSRSASICIAEVMRRAFLSLPRAYLFVRARRLNVIIQPNLRFMYELMKWEELEFARNLERQKLDPFTDKSEPGFSQEYKREMEWACLCKEIADLNKTYTSSP